MEVMSRQQEARHKQMEQEHQQMMAELNDEREKQRSCGRRWTKQNIRLGGWRKVRRYQC